jgi:Ca2+-binding EF-hand superfamily protein
MRAEFKLNSLISCNSCIDCFCRRWAWSQIDKNGTGVVLHKDFVRLNITYKEFLNKTESVTVIIKQCDKNNDKDLEVAEIMELLVVSAI